MGASRIQIRRLTRGPRTKDRSEEACLVQFNGQDMVAAALVRLLLWTAPPNGIQVAIEWLLFIGHMNGR